MLCGATLRMYRLVHVTSSALALFQQKLFSCGEDYNKLKKFCLLLCGHLWSPHEDTYFGAEINRFLFHIFCPAVSEELKRTHALTQEQKELCFVVQP